MLVPHCTTPSDTQSMLFRGIVHAYLCDPAFLFAFLSANRSQVDVSFETKQGLPVSTPEVYLNIEHAVKNSRLDNPC